MSTSVDSPAPNVAVIPLPPGFTIEQLFALQSNLVTIAITAAIAFAIVVWDYFYLLPDEYKYYQTANKTEWRTLAPYSFMTLRCSGVVSLLASMCISSFQSEHCQVGLAVSQIAAVVATATAGIAFGYMAMGVWGIQRRGIAFAIAIMWILMIGSWIAVGSQLRATNGAATPFGSNCQVQSFVFWTPLSHGLSFLFNLTILVFMVMKVREKRGQPSRTLRAAYTDSMILIAIATGASATILIIHSLGPDYQLVKQISMPFCTLITATMGARVFIILRIAPPVVTDGRVPVTNFQYATTVTQHVDSDKVAYVMGNPSPIPPPKDEKYDSTMSPSSYTASPSSYTASPSSYTKSPDSYTALSTPPQKYLSASSPSSASSSPQPQYMSPQRLIPAESPAFKAAPVAVPELQHNEYTTFPDPPSPPQAPQLHMRDGSIDSATPLLQTKFGIHIGPKKPKLRKKEDYSLKKDDYSSGWV